MTKTIEYRVRPVTRYHITRFEAEEMEAGLSQAGIESLGEFDSEKQAFKIADALFAHEIKDCPPGVTMIPAGKSTPSQTRIK